MPKDNSHIDWTINTSGKIIHPNNGTFGGGSFSGALVKLTADINNFGFSEIIGWDDEEYDIGGWHDTVTNNSRLTVPAGVSIISLNTNIALQYALSDSPWCYLLKNGVAFAGMPRMGGIVTIRNNTFNLKSPDLAVTPGDYFEVFIGSIITTNDILFNDGTWFSVKAVA